MTGCGGRRSERQTTGKEARWHMWRKKEKAREREEGTRGRGRVWSKGEAEMVRGTGTLETPFSCQMCKWSLSVVWPPPSQSLSG